MSVVAFLASCSKDNGGTDTPAPVEPQIVVPKTEVTTYKEEVGLRNEVTYEVVDNKITKLETREYRNNEKVYAEEYVNTYEGGFLTRQVLSITEGSASPTVSTTDYTYSAGKLTKKVENIGYGVNTANYEYQGDKLVKSVEEVNSFFGTQTTTTSYTYSETKITVLKKKVLPFFTRTVEVEYTLDTQKRVVKKVEKDGEQTTTEEYTYDDKNNFKVFDFIKVANIEWFLMPEYAKNNILTEKIIVTGGFSDTEETTTYTYTYTYNDKGYPTRVEEKTEREGEPAKTRVKEYTY